MATDLDTLSDMPNFVIESAHTFNKHYWAHHDGAKITVSSAYSNIQTGVLPIWQPIPVWIPSSVTQRMYTVNKYSD